MMMCRSIFICDKFLIENIRAFISSTFQIEGESRVVVGSRVFVVCLPWRGFFAHLCSLVGIRRQNVLAAALGLGACVLLAALDDTGALELLLALLGGDADEDDANDDQNDANGDSDNPAWDRVIAVNWFTVYGA